MVSFHSEAPNSEGIVAIVLTCGSIAMDIAVCIFNIDH